MCTQIEKVSKNICLYIKKLELVFVLIFLKKEGLVCHTLIVLEKLFLWFFFVDKSWSQRNGGRSNII